tara:strand:- start:1681 stop:1887 length:207 start_codon:yes stop_codon:yes gene_type:complete
MNSENEKIKKNFEENTKVFTNIINDYIEKINKAEYPEDVKKEILELFIEAVNNLNTELSENLPKTEEE